MFSQIVATKYHYVAHLTVFRGIHASKLVSHLNWTKMSPEIEFSSVITKQQVFFKKQFLDNIHITAFCYFW